MLHGNEYKVCTLFNLARFQNLNHRVLTNRREFSSMTLRNSSIWLSTEVYLLYIRTLNHNTLHNLSLKFN